MLMTEAIQAVQRIVPAARSEPQDLGAAFKAAMRDIAGTVTIIATRHEGERHGMAATSVVSLAMEPASMLFCVNRSASIYAPLLACGKAILNVLSSAHAELCGVFSGKVKGSARFEFGHWVDGPEGLPCLEEARQRLVVHTRQEFIYGTHAVFSAEIVEILPPGHPVPLVYLQGKVLDLD